MENWLVAAALASTAFPLVQGHRALQRSTLLQAHTWASAAWLLWLLVYVADALGDAAIVPLGRYLALCLTGCAAVAVLGARRPGVGPWNFVVCGLLAILVLPVVDLFEMQLRSDARMHLIFLAATLLLGATNYLPTRAGLAALLAGLGCGMMFALQLGATGRAWLEPTAGAALAVAPWLAWLRLRKQVAPREADRVWLAFRDAFGVVWGQRVREQLNRAAVNARWPVVLTWQGFQNTEPTPPDEAVVLETLRALLQRFESAADKPDAPARG